jgi:hypothetical protein
MTWLQAVTLIYAGLLLAGLWGAGRWFEQQHGPKK